MRGRQYTAALAEEDWEALRQTLPDAALNPEEQVLARERQRRVEQALTRLTAQEAQCLHLRLCGLRYCEIAEVLDTNVTMVARLLRWRLARRAGA